MTSKQINTITAYFGEKHMDRKQLEAALDFENLTMDEKYIPEIMELLKSSDDEVGENIIRNYVRFVKERSGSGEITWDELLERLKFVDGYSSDFGFRVQRFGKVYYELYFNNFRIQKYEDGTSKLTFDYCDYYDEKMDDANCSFEQYDIETEGKDLYEIFTQVLEKWNALDSDAKKEIIWAINNYIPEDTYKSRVDICNNDIEKITMTNADLIPEVGLRDYTINFKDGDMIHLRF